MSMSDMTSPLLTIGEVAKTCGVTKHALFHYDEIGLLKPEFVNDKGYRYYSLKQCYLLDLINVLRKTGSSLQEIKSYIVDQTPELLVSMFKEKQRELELEQSRLKRMHRLLQDAIDMTGIGNEEFISQPIIRRYDAEYLIMTKLEESGDKEFASKLSEHRSYCEQLEADHGFAIWCIIGQKRFMSGDFDPESIAYRLAEPVQTDRFGKKPAGLYVVMDHKGTYESAPNTFEIIKTFIDTNELQVKGDAYSVDLLNYYSEKNPENFLLRMMVRIAD
ncbi:MerR family transcriptional regulator [Paenibacillus sp. strain BS8-2]